MAGLTIANGAFTDERLSNVCFCWRCNGPLKFTAFPAFAHPDPTWAVGCDACERHAYVAVAHASLLAADTRAEGYLLIQKAVNEAWDKLDADHPLRVRLKEAEW